MFRYVIPITFLAIFTGCGGGHPWNPVKVSGKITYEDGSVIPADSIQLMFKPQVEAIDGGKTNPRMGKTGVNTSDGTFGNVTTYEYGDGLIRGKHKVVVIARQGGERGSRSKAVPREYGSPTTTPLELDTADSPVHLKIRKP